jgi:heme O synthase-like polyprenyltransferase
VTECGKENIYALIVTVILLPFFLIRRLSKLAIVSAVVLVVTFIAMSIQIYYSTEIIRNSPALTKKMFN